MRGHNLFVWLGSSEPLKRIKLKVPRFLYIYFLIYFCRLRDEEQMNTHFMKATRIIRKSIKRLRRWFRKYFIFSKKRYGTPLVYLGKQQK
jgi:hypothetical protein